MDKLDIRLGQRWELEVEGALNSCSRMLVIVSPASVASRNVLAEAAFAIDEGKEVIPVLIQECKIPFRLRPFQYADFRSDYSVGLGELLASLGGGQQAASSAEAVALSAIRDALREAEERERLEAERVRQEQAEAERLAAQTEATRRAVEEKAHQDQLERQRLAQEHARLEEERQRIAEEQARLDAERKLAAAEKARLVLQL